MYVRKKTISRDELTIKIGSLSIEQVEHVNDPLDADDAEAAKLLSHPSNNLKAANPGESSAAAPTA